MTSRFDLYSEAELEAEENRERERRQTLVSQISEALELRGLAEVLADIVESGHVRS